MIRVVKPVCLSFARRAGVVLVLVLGWVGPVEAAAVALNLRVNGDAADDRFFPSPSRLVECLPACATQASRDDAQPASIVTGAIEGHQNFGNASMRVDVHGRARIGDLGLSVSTFAGADARRARGTVFALTEASWRDVITLTTADVPLGERITIEASMNLFGVLDAIATGEGKAAAVLQIFDLGAPSLLPSVHGGSTFGQQTYDLARNTFIDKPVDTVVHLRMSLFNGLPTAIGYRLSLSADSLSFDTFNSVNSATPGSAEVDAIAIDSLHWGGIQRVADRFGNTVDSFSVASESGFDFSRAFSTDGGPSGVPEPASMALVLAAWAASRSLGRRR